MSFDFRPLWQMDAASAAAIALQKAQATQIYAGLNLWPKDVTARLVESQLIEDGVFPGAEAIFGAAKAAGVVADRGGSGHAASRAATDVFNPAQPRDPDGRWTGGGAGAAAVTPDPSPSRPPAAAQIDDPELPDGAALGHVPNGTPIEAARFKGAGRNRPARIIGALLGYAGGFLRRLPNPFETDEPILPKDTPPGGSSTETAAPPNTTTQVQADLPQNFSPEETAGLSQLFKGGGKEGSVLGAQRLLDQISQGPVDLPPSVTPEVLERYADIARKAISQGRDKLGVQALRLNAINELLKR